MTRRTDRVEDLLRAELAQLLLRDVNDPRVRLATVSEVTVTSDLRHICRNCQRSRPSQQGIKIGTRYVVSS